MAAQAAEAPRGSIHQTIKCGRAAYTFEPQTVQCMVSLRACSYTPAERKPIDLVLVLDKSGSMSGEKLALIKQTAGLIVTELSARGSSGNDRLSIVTYDTTVKCLMPLAVMDASGKKRATDSIESIRAGSTTNLSGGLLRGLEEVSEVEQPADNTSVFLMTDGHANSGITESEGIVRCLEGVMAERTTPCTVFTFGYGTNHNAEMLRAISDAGCGQYYAMENGDAVATSFADALGGLLSVVGQNLRLRVRASGGARISQPLGKGYRVANTSDDSSLELILGDVYSEEAKDLLFEVELPAAVDLTEQAVITTTMSYVDVVNATLTTALVSQTAVVRAEHAGAMDEGVSLHMNRVLVAGALERAARMAQTRRYQEGRQILRDAIATLQASAVPQAALTTQLLANLRECLDGMQSEYDYSSRGSYLCHSSMQSHYKQRANSMSSPAAAVTANGSLDASASPYLTTPKRRMQERWSQSDQSRPGVAAHSGGGGGAGRSSRGGAAASAVAARSRRVQQPRRRSGSVSPASVGGQHGAGGQSQQLPLVHAVEVIPASVALAPAPAPAARPAAGDFSTVIGPVASRRRRSLSYSTPVSASSA
eukprot:COSAG01_NODE_4419_length_5043_cov_37.692152_3_plen_595_part_00